MVKDRLFASPSCCALVPAVPGSVDISKGRVICQHSIVDLPSAAPIAVMFRCVVFWATADSSRNSRNKAALCQVCMVRA